MLKSIKIADGVSVPLTREAPLKIEGGAQAHLLGLVPGDVVVNATFADGTRLDVAGVTAMVNRMDFDAATSGKGAFTLTVLSKTLPDSNAVHPKLDYTNDIGRGSRRGSDLPFLNYNNERCKAILSGR